MKETYVVHFGAGALGRGLVVPMLYESNCQIVLADTDKRLLNFMKDRKSYKLHVSDDQEHPIQIIPIKDIVSPIEEEEKLIQYLQKSDIITTSVRKENLKYICNVIVRAWGTQDCTNKMIICCENVEGVGSYFKELLLKACVDKEIKEVLQQVKVPDTIVDRICAVNDDVEVIVSESFHECSVDASIVKESGLKMIPSVQNITSHFYRKRYLLNTYADAMAFLGKTKGLTYLYEAAHHEGIQKELHPYIELLKTLLDVEYHIPLEESSKWFEIYRHRLSNDAIPRNLDTVARNLWDKLSVSERFICPILQLMKKEVHIVKGLPVLHDIIFSCGLSKKEIYDRLKICWNDAEGKKLLILCKKEWDL